MSLTENALMQDAETDPDLLVYDFLKHLTSLSLLSIGGVLTMPEALDRPIEPIAMGVILLLLAFGGAMALHGLEAITKARSVGKPAPKSLKWYRSVASSSLGMGVGAFISFFTMTAYLG